MSKKLLDFSSAYAQLILMVFIPIAVMAGVGAYLVERETSKAIESEQRTLATAALIRYEPLVKELLPTLIANDMTGNVSESMQTQFSKTDLEQANLSDVAIISESLTGIQFNRDGENGYLNEENSIESGLNPETSTNSIQSLNKIKARIGVILATMHNDQHIQRVSVIDSKGRVIASTSEQSNDFWADIKDLQLTQDQNFIAGVPTTLGTAYGHLLGRYDMQSVVDEQTALTTTFITPNTSESGNRDDASSYWLFVEMDDEPLTIARLRVWLVLGLTGLFALLLLLLSLNIYAKRWIVPIYDLRLHLQGITSETMYRPVNAQSSGELNQLQQEIAKTLRRLYGDFQELKNHADQTEDDLRDAFDEMEMQNIFIREARDQAILSSQTKSAFLANISHELRTPLNSINGFINLLSRNGQLSTEQDLYVQTIRKSSAHLLALVNDVLDFSKIEAGKLVLDKHEFNLYDAIYDVMDMLSPLAAEKGLRMAVLYYNDVPLHIVGDALRVKQILTNLVGNAIKFTDVGEVIVRVGLEEGLSDNQKLPDTDSDISAVSNTVTQDMIHIAVEDSGYGISDNVKKQLFKSFSQGDPSVTRQYGGTGLGLVISKQLTQLMGGQIGFYDNNQESGQTGDPAQNVNEDAYKLGNSSHVVTQSSIKSGATFWFNMPANITSEDVLDVDHQASEEFKLPVLRPFTQPNVNGSKGVKNASPIEDKPFDILVWIKHATSRQVLNASLQPLSVTVTIASSLAGALERLKEEWKRWDWVVIDGGVGTSSDDMAALLKQVRSHYQGKLAIYGYQVALDAALLERYRADGLYQPLDKRQLYRILDTRANKRASIVPAPTWQGVTVLAVDDHLPNLLVLDALLSELGINVITANSGHDAIDIVSKKLTRQLKALGYGNNDDAMQQDLSSDSDSGSDSKQISAIDRIDLIFMDIQMPRMSGREATRHIRLLEVDAQKTAKNYQALSQANEEDTVKTTISNEDMTENSGIKRLPIIALTAQGLAEQKAAFKASGLDDYVGKPIDRPQLLRILQRWLGKKSSITSDASVPAVLAQPDPPLIVSHQNVSSTTDNPDRHSDSNSNNNGNGKGDGDNGYDDNNKQPNSILPVVDWQDALTRSAHKPDLAEQLLFMMQDTVLNELTELEQAWQARDREQLALLAHRILGASRYTGVPQVRKASQDLEDKSLLDVKHTIPSQFTMLEPYYSALINSLQALQDMDLEAYIKEHIKKEKVLNAEDMTWKM